MPYRVAFYCHWIKGLGHFCRSLHLSEGLARDHHFEIALFTSKPPPTPVPEAIKCIELPHVSETMRAPGDVRALMSRADIIRGFCRNWRPDCLIVDHLPLGLSSELLPTLIAARQEGWHTRFAIGIPYLEGMPSPVGKGHSSLAYRSYSIAIGYLDPGLDPLLENLPMFPSLKFREYVGVAVPSPNGFLPGDPREPKRIVVLCGGGLDAGDLFPPVLNACRSWLVNKRARVEIVLGPMARWTFPESFSIPPGTRLRATGRVEECVNTADLIIARCGYNTAFTAVQSPAPIVFIPRPEQDNEQTHRARMLARLDRIWSVEEGQGHLSRTLAEALGAALNAPVRPRILPFSGNAPARLATFLDRVLQRRLVPGNEFVPIESSTPFYP